MPRGRTRPKRRTRQALATMERRTDAQRQPCNSGGAAIQWASRLASWTGIRSETARGSALGSRHSPARDRCPHDSTGALAQPSETPCYRLHRLAIMRKRTNEPFGFRCRIGTRTGAIRGGNPRPAKRSALARFMRSGTGKAPRPCASSEHLQFACDADRLVRRARLAHEIDEGPDDGRHVPLLGVVQMPAWQRR